MQYENIDRLPIAGFLREKQVLKLFPVSRSSWWKGIADGRYPAPVKLGPRMSAWRVEDIRCLIDNLSTGQGA